MDTFEDRIRAYWNTISSDEELWRNFVRDNLDDGARESQLFVAIFHFHSIPILAKLFQDAAVNASSESALLLRKVCDYRLFVDMEDEGWVFFNGIANLLLHNEEEARICCGPVREIIMATLKHKIPYDEFSSYVAHAILNEEGNYLARIDQIVMTMPDFFVDFVKSHLSLCYELDEKGFLSCFKKVLKEGFHLWPFLALMHLLANVLPLSPAGDEPMKDMLEAALSTDIFKDDLQTDSNSKLMVAHSLLKCLQNVAYLSPSMAKNLAHMSFSIQKSADVSESRRVAELSCLRLLRHVFEEIDRRCMISDWKTHY